MLTLDPVGRWITRRTGRTLDQHAADPIPAAAHLPQAACCLGRARTELLLTIDRLRTALINEDDLTGTIAAVTRPLAAIEQLGREYRYARNWADLLNLTFGPGQRRLPHAEAGIYHDPAHGTLYVLEPAGDEPAASRD